MFRTYRTLDTFLENSTLNFIR